MIELNQAEVGSVGGGVRTIAGVWSDGAVPPDCVGRATEPHPISGGSYCTVRIGGVRDTARFETIAPPPGYDTYTAYILEQELG